MEAVLAALACVNVAATAVVGVGLWRRTTPVPPITLSAEDASAPEWGTPARVEWHRELRDYHRKQMSEAQRAIRADAVTEG